MGPWILETYRHSPGTVQLVDDHVESAARENVLLVPLPSNSPNDVLVSACYLPRKFSLLTRSAFVGLASIEEGPGVLHPGFFFLSGGDSRYFHECSLGLIKVQYQSLLFRGLSCCRYRRAST